MFCSLDVAVRGCERQRSVALPVLDGDFGRAIVKKKFGYVYQGVLGGFVKQCVSVGVWLIDKRTNLRFVTGKQKLNNNKN